ncbi:MAG: hypothetical protein U1E65_08200 [Myxococcota bacterium]
MLPALLALTVVGSVTVQLQATRGLNAGDEVALVRAFSSAVEQVTGAPPRSGAEIQLEVEARRVGSRIRIEALRKERAQLVGRAEADLTRDTASWDTPVVELVAGLLPEGAQLAAAPMITAPLVNRPPSQPDAQEAVPSSPILAVAPAPARSHTVPWIVIGASAAVAGLGAMFVVNASNSLSASMSTVRGIPNPAVLEAQQRSVFEGALLGSVLLSAAASGLVTGVVLLVSD